MGERVVSDEELEQLVAKRLGERKEIINEAVAALRPELVQMRQEIADANHIKRTLGRQLTRVETLLRQTVAEVRTHSQLPFHPEGADTIRSLSDEAQKGVELLDAFGVEKLSLEEKQALPSVLGEHVRERRDRKTLDRRTDRRMTLYLVIATALGSVFGGVLSAIAVIAYISQSPLGRGGP